MEIPLVSVSWLSSHLSDNNIVLLDATIPKVGASGTSNGSPILGIKGAQILDLKKTFSDIDHHLPNMMPSQDAFILGCKSMGIANDTQVILYDRHGIYSSPRAWWMFKTMGHNDVYVLDGGLPEWIERDGEVTALSMEDSVAKEYLTDFQENLVCDSSHVMRAKENENFLILDARSSGRFNGTSPEPRPELRGGHIPNSKSLPYTNLIQDNLFLSKTELKAIFDNINPNRKNLIFSCGSGITACVLALGANIAGHSFGTVYDGSWSEWGLSSEFPVEI